MPACTLCGRRWVGGELCRQWQRQYRWGTACARHACLRTLRCSCGWHVVQAPGCEAAAARVGGRRYEACLPVHPPLLLWQALTSFALLLRGNEEGHLFEACPHPPLPGWRWLPQQEAYLIRQDEARSTRATCCLHVVQVLCLLGGRQRLGWSAVTTYYNHCFVFRMRCKIVV